MLMYIDREREVMAQLQVHRHQLGVSRVRDAIRDMLARGATLEKPPTLTRGQKPGRKVTAG